MIDKPAAAEAPAVHTIFDLLAKAGPVFEESEARHTKSKSKQPIVVPSASEMVSPLMVVAKKDDRSMPPNETTEPMIPLAATFVNEPVLNDEVQ